MIIPIALTMGLIGLATLLFLAVLLIRIVRQKDETSAAKRHQLVVELTIFWLSTGLALSVLIATLGYTEFCKIAVGQTCSHFGMFLSSVIPAALFWPTYTVSAALSAANGEPLSLCCCILATAVGLFAVYSYRKRTG